MRRFSALILLVIFAILIYSTQCYAYNWSYPCASFATCECTKIGKPFSQKCLQDIEKQCNEARYIAETSNRNACQNGTQSKACRNAVRFNQVLDTQTSCTK